MTMLRTLLLSCLALMPLAANAELKVAEQLEGPHRVVAEVQEKLLAVVKDKADYLESDPQVYFKSVAEVLDPVVSFDYIARGVMGSYAKVASAEQRARFAETFRNSLIQTYAKGMANYADQTLEVLPPEHPVGDARRVEVEQDIHTQDGITRVSYTLGKTKTGQWKLINVVLDGINLGHTFAGQFSQAMTKSGDIDTVIAEWGSQG